MGDVLKPKLPDKSFLLRRFNVYITQDKPRISKELIKTMDACADKAVGMVKELVDRGCSVGIAIELSILTLYDLVVLIDDSSSMKYEDGGKRIDTLKAVLEKIVEVYKLANSNGIKSVRYLNHRQGKGNVGVGDKDVDVVISRTSFTGLSMIGTELHKKILDPFVLNPTDGIAMGKPLLVMIITDGEVEGERDGLLEKVILNCLGEMASQPDKGQDAVAFQFSHIGDDPGAKGLLKRLDKHNEVGGRVGCLTADMPLELMEDNEEWEKEKWRVLPKLMLGAVLPYMDNREEVLTFGTKVDTFIPNVDANKVPDDD